MRVGATEISLGGSLVLITVGCAANISSVPPDAHEQEDVDIREIMEDRREERLDVMMSDARFDWSEACSTSDRCVAADDGRCAAGSVACGGCCVDPLSDHDNCGACDHACDVCEVCYVGACRNENNPNVICCEIPGCPPSFYRADPRSDRTNCGMCGNVCSRGSSCVDGGCM